MQKLLTVSLAFTLNTIRNTDERETVDELIKILHHEKFRVVVFRRFVKTSSFCEVITEIGINQKKDVSSRSK